MNVYVWDLSKEWRVFIVIVPNLDGAIEQVIETAGTYNSGTNTSNYLLFKNCEPVDKEPYPNPDYEEEAEELRELIRANKPNIVPANQQAGWQWNLG